MTISKFEEWTVDFQAQEFRKVDKNGFTFVPFDSKLGQELLKKMNKGK